MKKLVIAASVFAACAVNAQEMPKLYGEVGYTPLKIEVDDFNGDVKPALVRGILGADVHPNVGVEFMLGLGAKDDTVNAFGVPVKTEVERSFGIYIKPKFNPTEQLELFARLGYADTKLKISALGVSDSESEGDFSFGAGLSYSFTPTAYGTVDYMSYHDKDGVKINGFTLGVGFKF
jgi:opacity protein-like surface antigen